MLAVQGRKKVASNDDVLLGVPNIQCPSCMSTLCTTNYQRIDKFSKKQRKQRHQKGGQYYGETVRSDTPMPEDIPSEAPENNFVVVSCSNEICEQYNRIKVLRLPRIECPTVKVDL
jgi:hypothetical protein